jgi:hypothetical protein
VVQQSLIEPVVISQRVIEESPPLLGDGAIDAAARVNALESDGPLQTDQASEVAGPDASGPDALLVRRNRRAIEQQALRTSVMQRVRSWLRRAS